MTDRLTATPGKDAEVWECANCGEWCQVSAPGENYDPEWDGPLISGYGAGGVICFHIDSEEFECDQRAVDIKPLRRTDD